MTMWGVHALAVVCLLAAASGFSDVMRINYGVIFDHAGFIDNGAQQWTHTFLIDFPRMKLDQLATPRCPKHVAITCKEFHDLFATMAHHRAEVHEEIERVNESLKYLFRTVDKLLLRGPNRRGGLLPFFGDFFKTVFGSATDADFEVLRKNMKEVTDLIDAMDQSATLHAKNMSSFGHLMNKEFNSLDRKFQDMHGYLVTVARDSLGTVRNMVQKAREISLALTHNAASASEAVTELQTFNRGLVALSRGRLSPDLLPPSVVQKLMETIQSTLQEHHPSFHLEAHNPDYFYQLSSFVAAKTSKKLIVSVSIPVSSTATLKDLYRVKTFPLLYRNDSSHATILEDLPAYFAVAKDKSGYLEISEETMQTCKLMGMLMVCPKVLPKAKPSRASCAWGLYQDDKAMVQETCQNSLLVNGLKPDLLELEPGTILMSKISRPIIQCRKESKLVRPCQQCVVKLPCECSLVTEGPYFPESLQLCQDRAQEVQVLHHTNLNLLKHFLNASVLNEIDGNLLLPEPTYFVPATPDLSSDFLDHFPELQDNQLRLPLAPVIDKVRKHEKIMVHVVQAGADAEVKSRQSSLATEHGFLEFSLASTVIALVMVIVTFMISRSLYTRAMIFNR